MQVGITDELSVLGDDLNVGAQRVGNQQITVGVECEILDVEELAVAVAFGSK